MRCDQCQKFVSFDTDAEPDDLDVSVDDEGVVTGTVHIVNNCAECGQGLTESTLDVEVDLSGDVATHRDEAKTAWEAKQAELPEDEREPFNEGDHDTMTLESSDASRSDRRQTKDRRGKTITNPRYQKQFYGAEVSVTISCKCGESFSQSDTAEVQASGMESMV